MLLGGIVGWRVRECAGWCARLMHMWVCIVHANCAGEVHHGLTRAFRMRTFKPVSWVHMRLMICEHVHCLCIFMQKCACETRVTPRQPAALAPGHSPPATGGSKTVGVRHGHQTLSENFRIGKPPNLEVHHLRILTSLAAWSTWCEHPSKGSRKSYELRVRIPFQQGG